MEQGRRGIFGTETRIATLAAAQHGVVTRTQLLQLGVGRSAIDRRLRDGVLRVVHRGVFAVGPLPGRYAREMAAVLACGEGAAVGGRSAGALFGLTPPQPAAEPVYVIVGRRTGRRQGIEAHRLDLAPDEVTRVEGVPVTTAARALLDLAAVLATAELERALAVADRERLATRASLETLLARRAHQRGAGALQAFLDLGREPAFDRSEAERRMLALLRRARLPMPAVNARIHGLEVDFHWRAQQVVVEIDGFAFHSSRTAFEHDRQRDQLLAAAGIVVMRVTWWQLTREPLATVVRIAQLLTRQEMRLEALTRVAN
jgi:very-short-patch-repair endonuclease